MNRRMFFASAAAPFTASVIPAKSIIPFYPPFTEHDEYVIRICSENMNCLAQADDFFCKIFRSQYEKMITRRITGVQPMISPCNLLFTKSEKDEIKPEDRLLYKRPYRTMPLPEMSLKQRPVLSSSMPLDNPRHLAEKMDKHTIQMLDWISKPVYLPSVSATGHSPILYNSKFVINKHSYVLCHPSKEEQVQERTGLIPITTELMPVTQALIGWKENDYSASLYYLPYIPLTVFAVTKANDLKTVLTKFKSRYALESEHGMWSEMNFQKPAAFRLHLS